MTAETEYLLNEVCHTLLEIRDLLKAYRNDLLAGDTEIMRRVSIRAQRWTTPTEPFNEDERREGVFHGWTQESDGIGTGTHICAIVEWEDGTVSLITGREGRIKFLDPVTVPTDDPLAKPHHHGHKHPWPAECPVAAVFPNPVEED